MKSIQARLALWLLASVLLASALLIAFTRAAADALTRAYVVEGLRDDAENLIAGLRIDAAGRLEVESRRVPPKYVRSYSGSYFVIDGGTGSQRLRSRSLWDVDLTLEPCPEAECITTVPGPLGQTLLVRAGTFEVGGRRVSIAVAEDLGPLTADLATFARRFALIVLGISTVLVVLQAAVLRISLAPLERLRTHLTMLERGEIDRLPESVPHEIRPVVTEINRVHAALQARLTRSRNSLGNLAHALKTPLTRARQLLAVRAAAGHTEAIEQALAQIGTTVESQLQRARVAGRSAATRRTALAEVVEDLLLALEAVFADKQIAVETAVPVGLSLQADREDLLELLGNLLDNAFKWADARVRISAAANGICQIHVEDDGPGVAGEDLDALSRRGERIDESTTGHGLGLAICSEIAAEYGATLRFARSATLGGLHATIEWPVAPHGERTPGD